MADSKLRERELQLLNAPDKETVVKEALSTPVQTSLPTTWRDSAGKTHLPGSAAAIIRASEEDVSQFGFPPTRVCGTCRYFDLSSATRNELIKQRFSERLVHEHGWRMKFLGVPLEHIGLCGQSNGEMATTSVSNAGNCDGYRPVRFSEKG